MFIFLLFFAAKAHPEHYKHYEHYEHYVRYGPLRKMLWVGTLKSALKASLNKYVPARRTKKSLEVIRDLRGCVFFAQ